MAACLKILIAARMASKTRTLLGSRNRLPLPCVLWTGAQSRGGGRPKSGPYGSIWVPGIGPIRAHVAAAWVSDLIDAPRVPTGMNLDHECERPLCVEPSHLSLVPAMINQKLRWQRRRRVPPSNIIEGTRAC
jgi:hypothetical protein